MENKVPASFKISVFYILSLTLFCTISSLVVFEIYFQNYLKPKTENTQFCSLNNSRDTFNFAFGWWEYPNDKYFEKRDGWHLYTYNELGGRNNAEPYDNKKKGVIVLGDSYTKGANTNDETSIPSLLSLNSPSHYFFNLGVGGSGTMHQNLIYEGFANYIRHDYVILNFYAGNDVRNNVYPKLLTDNGKFKLSSVFAHFWQLSDEMGVMNSGFAKILNSVLYRIGIRFRPPGLFDEEDRMQVLEESLAYTGDILTSLNNTILNKGAKLILILHPPAPAETMGVEIERRIATYLSNFSKRNEIAYLDLSTTKKRLKYGTVDPQHYTTEGYVTVSKVIKDFLRTGIPEARFFGDWKQLEVNRHQKPDCSLVKVNSRPLRLGKPENAPFYWRFAK